MRPLRIFGSHTLWWSKKNSIIAAYIDWIFLVTKPCDDQIFLITNFVGNETLQQPQISIDNATTTKSFSITPPYGDRKNSVAIQWWGCVEW
jgi:hypothetical protein